MALDPAHIHAFQVSPPKLPEVTVSESERCDSSDILTELELKLVLQLLKRVLPETHVLFVQRFQTGSDSIPPDVAFSFNVAQLGGRRLCMK